MRLRERLFSIVVLTLVATALTVGLAFYTFGRYFITSTVTELLKVQNQIVITQIEKFTQERIRDLFLLSTWEEFESWEKNPDQIKAILYNTRNIYRTYESISFIDPQYIVQFDTRGVGIGKIAAESQHLQNIDKSEGAYFSFSNPDFKKKSIVFVAPVSHAKTKKLIGYVMARVSSDRFVDIFARINKFYLESLVTPWHSLHNTSGDVFYETNSKFHSHDGSHANNKGYHEHNSVTDEGDIVKISSLAEGKFSHFWHLETRFSEKEIAQKFNLIALYIGLVALLLIAGLFYVVQKIVRTTTEPIERLSQALQMADAGKFQKVDIKIATDAEVKSLINSYNGMADRVENSIAEVSNSRKFAALGEMASGIAHEINNPLAVISGFASLAQINIKAQNYIKASENLEKLGKTVVRISSVISILRQYSREAKHDPMISTSIRKVIEDTVVFCAEKMKLNEVQLHISFEHEDTMAHGRATQISQILFTLINNAFDAASVFDDRWIRISVTENMEFVEINVSNSGEKISIEAAEKLFLPFYFNRSAGGAGLGLSISKGVANDHGGDLKFDDSKPFTQFTLTIPKALTQAKAA
jgi:signal transduction histidine kinase